ncbi:hypothetical protein [Nocardioides sp. SYSU D00038]|uniref:hypothetical protein n=1 Tax=Nocardioides sp. SYSU D00038 TaxID=2812554 RepID=UPI0019672CF4|nr:hypothetical protein [Nocardioides sp. SYSU D00038]
MKRVLASSLLVTACAAAGLAVVPSTASAVPPSLFAQVRSDIDLGEDGQPNCAVTDLGDNANEPLLPDGSNKVQQLSDTAVVSDPGDAADVSDVSGSITTTSRLTRAGGTLGTFGITTRATARAKPRPGSDAGCFPYAASGSSVDVVFGIATAGWLTVTTSSPRVGRLEWNVEGDSPDPVQHYGGSTGAGERTSTVFLTPDLYELEAYAVVERYPGAPGSDANGSATGTMRLQAEFHPIGSATGDAVGVGSRFVTLPAAVTCADGRATISFRKASRHVKKAKLLVNGVARRTVRNPRGGKVVALRGLAGLRRITLQARLTMEGGKKGKKVSRSYWPCGAP